MDKSTHRVEVVEVHPQPHPNADRLDVVQIEGYICVTGKGNFKDGELGVYFPPDTIAPAIAQFKFVWEGKGFLPAPGTNEFAIPEKYRRIKAKKIRGMISEGLLLPLSDFTPLIGPGPKPFGWEAGDDLAEKIGCTHYNPPELGGDVEAAPVKKGKKGGHPKTLRGWIGYLLSFLPGRRRGDGHEDVNLPIPNYDIDAWQKYGRLLNPGEVVWITEKIHGANARYVFMNARMYAGSHYQWKKYCAGNEFWLALAQNPWIEDFCKTFPGFVLYGELVPTQGTAFSYGQKPREFRVFAFDVYDQIAHKFLSCQELDNIGWVYHYMVGETFVHASLVHKYHWVPTVDMLPYDPEKIRALSVGPSLIEHAGNKREGIVIKTLDERYDPRLGRIILKLKDPEFKD